MSSLVLPPMANGDAIIPYTNGNNDLIEAAVNNIDGANIINTSIPIAKLQSQRGLFTFCFNIESLGALANGDFVWGFKLPNVDGASSSSWSFLGHSAFARAIVGGAGNLLQLTKNPPGGGIYAASMVDFGTLVAGTPVTGAPAVVPNAGTSGDLYRIVYTKAGGPTLTGVSVVLFFSHPHVTV